MGKRSPWISRGIWALVDQGTFALANFVIGILLARWLPAAGYGAFSVAYAALLFVGSIHTALLTEPLLVKGSAVNDFEFSILLNGALRAHMILTCAVVVGMGAIGTAIFLTGNHDLGSVLVCMGLAIPGVLFSWLLRRACLARFASKAAALAGLAYLTLVIVGMYSMHAMSILSAGSAAILLGLAGLLASGWLLALFSEARARKSADIGGLEVIRENWAYSRWAIVNAICSWTPVNAFVVMLPLFVNLEAAAGIRAVLNLFMPVLQGITVLALLLIAVLVRRRGTIEFGRIITFSMLAGALLASLYWMLVAGFQSQLFDIIYDGGYKDYARAVWLLGLIVICKIPEAVYSSALRAIERPDKIAAVYVLVALVTFVVGLWCVAGFGFDGAVYGMMTSAACAGGGMAIAYYRFRRSSAMAINANAVV